MAAIVVFSDVLLSNSVIEAGVRGKNMRLNSRVPTDNGFESVNIIWTQTLRQFELGFVPMRVAQWQAIETLHEITEGGAFGFLMEDPKDNNAADGVMTLVSTHVYQLHKRYVEPVSTRFKTRKITRPRLSGLVVKVSGVTLDPASYTLDPTTGRITIPGSTPAASTLTWTGLFYLPVHFMDDSIDWTLVVAGVQEQRYLSGPSVMLQEIRE
jgi:uncharacterized protein (TIGR02217 family)